MPDYIRYFAGVIAIIAGLSLTPDAYSERSGKASGGWKRKPEPMVFDLIDPLGTPKGDLELNTLLDYSPRTGQLEWSPEVEYIFADGYGVELQLPFGNTELDAYQLAFQGTFGELAKGRMIHGWQAKGRRELEEKVYAADLLYLNGYQFSNKWSMMNMLGARHTAIGKSGDFIGLVNNSVFYSFSERFSIGVELNSEIGERDWHYRLTPQLQYAINKDTTIQAGGGPSQLNDENKTEWLLTSRVIFDF